ncbi:MAG: saccharopine dehydrogenase NADP-binding domain-containing protein [Candidatus Nanopelagicales bacterium]|nr:saccharopine dehydrogenase NADP-binding domain-containing protein [Candidatus Nanopelagicales bacterium]MDZ4249395.1 saccharopine dehydrogenase NADP-binding domain-containing protein [Candidatus Nanopelagicales bacterium]
MSKIVLLGGCGGIGTIAARTVLAANVFTDIVIADLDGERAEALAASFRRKRVVGVGVDVDDPSSLRRSLDGASVVLNTVGPFYRFGPQILAAAIDSGVDYVDVCDDLDATERMLQMDAAAKAKGVRALLGMGNSPGLANVLARFAADQLLDSVESVDIMHIHGGEPQEGPAVLGHRIHAMTSDIPIWEDGQMRKVRMLDDSGAAYVIEVDFRDVGRFPVYPYPHPETITLPRYLPGVRRVTNRGVVFPLSYFELTQDLVRADACGTAPLRVGGVEVVPRDFSVAHLIATRPRLLAEAAIDGPAGCLVIDVRGQKEGAPERYVFSLSSRSAGAGEGTGIPAGIGAVLMAEGEGKIAEAGVYPPEAVVDPLRMLNLASGIVGSLGVEGSGSGSLPIHVERHRPDGVSELNLAF